MRVSIFSKLPGSLFLYVRTHTVVQFLKLPDQRVTVSFLGFAQNGHLDPPCPILLEKGPFYRSGMGGMTLRRK